jgi:hypothetical protein
VNVDLKSLWPEVWDRICRHMDGMAIGSTVAALENSGVLVFLSQPAPVSFSQVCERFPGNAGYLHVAFRLLACQGWLKRIGEPGTDTLELEPTPNGRKAFALASRYAPAVAFLPSVRHLENALFGLDKTNIGSALATSYQHIQNEWGLPQYDADPNVRPQVRHHLDGHVITPLMSIMSLRGASPSSREQSSTIDLRILHGNIDSLRLAFEILATQGWANVAAERVEFTPQGMLAMTCARQYWYPMGYLETFIQVPQLLFGDPSVTLARTEAGDESHVDRKLDIRFSGSVFSKTCRQPFLESALPIFDRKPLESQPSAIVDTGCGDGSLLRVLYENIRDQTLRGRSLANYPLVVVGVEPNRVAREVAGANLEAARIPNHIIDGNIADPRGLARALHWLAIDAENSLHVSKSVIHNRPYQRPEDLEQAEKRQATSTGAFVAPDGSVVPNAFLEQNLVEHFKSWRGLASRHGLLVIEAHTVDPAMTAKLIGKTVATVVDATQYYSNQYLVEPEVFMGAARAAGFASQAHREIGKSSVGHTVLTIDHLVTR